MEKRNSQRISVGLEAELVSGYVSFTAFIGNVSALGIHIITIHTDEKMDINHKEPLRLKFRIPAGDMLNLRCRKRWASTISSSSLLSRMGMEIIKPPRQYIEYVKTLQ